MGEAYEIVLDELTSALFASLPRSDQRRRGVQYIQGLLRARGRKSIRNIATLIDGAASEQSLHHFVCSSTWDWMPVRQELSRYLDRLAPPYAWVVRPVLIPKAGTHSVGVGRRFVPALGQVLNAQQAVSVWAVSPRLSAPVNWRLHLPGPAADGTRAADRAPAPPAPGGGTLSDCVAETFLEVATGWQRPAVPVVLDARELAVPALLGRLRAAGAPLMLRVRRTLPLTPAGAGQRESALPAHRILRMSGLPHRLAPTAAEAGREARTLVASVRVSLPGSATGGPRGEEELVLLGAGPKGRHWPTEVWLSDLVHHRPAALLGLSRSAARVDRDFAEIADRVGVRDFAGRSYNGWHRHVTLASAAHTVAALARSSAARLPGPPGDLVRRAAAPREQGLPDAVQPQGELDLQRVVGLLPVGAEQSADPLQAAADGVGVDEELLGGVGRAAAGAEPGLQGLGQLGEPLPVVVEDGADRRVDEGGDVAVVGEQRPEEAEFAGGGGAAGGAEGDHRVEALVGLLERGRGGGLVGHRSRPGEGHGPIEERRQLVHDGAGGLARVGARQDQDEQIAPLAREPAGAVGVQRRPGDRPAQLAGLRQGDQDDMRPPGVQGVAPGLPDQRRGAGEQVVQVPVAAAARGRGGTGLDPEQQHGHRLGEDAEDLYVGVGDRTVLPQQDGAEGRAPGPDRGGPAALAQGDRAARGVRGHRCGPVALLVAPGRGAAGGVEHGAVGGEDAQHAAGPGGGGLGKRGGGRPLQGPADQAVVQLPQLGGGPQPPLGLLVAGAEGGQLGARPLQGGGLLQGGAHEFAEQADQGDLLVREVPGAAVGEVEGTAGSAAAERCHQDPAHPLGRDRRVQRGAVPDALVVRVVGGPDRDGAGDRGVAEVGEGGQGEADGTGRDMAVRRADEGRAAVRAGQHDAGQVGPEQQAGPPGDQVQEGARAEGPREFQGDAQQGGQSGLPLAPLFAPLVDGPAEPDSLLDGREAARVGLAAAGPGGEGLKPFGRSSFGQQFQDGEGAGLHPGDLPPPGSPVLPLRTVRCAGS
ncbi:putative transposase [Streptomyces albus]|nr:putative transposase [Streptomyces albus]